VRRLAVVAQNLGAIGKFVKCIIDLSEAGCVRRARESGGAGLRGYAAPRLKAAQHGRALEDLHDAGESALATVGPARATQNQPGSWPPIPPAARMCGAPEMSTAMIGPSCAELGRLRRMVGNQ